MAILKMQARTYYLMYVLTGSKGYLLQAMDLACWYRCKKSGLTLLHTVFNVREEV